MFKNKKWICSFIALFILISGMWNAEVVELLKTDSVFLCSKTADALVINELSDINSEQEILSDVPIESIQILCTRNAISSQQIVAQIISAKRVIKLSMIFLCVAIFALLLSNFYTTGRIIEYPTLSMRTVVLNYIHNQDGKK